MTDTSTQKQLDDSIYGIEKKPFPYLLCVTNMLLHDIEVPNIYHMNSLKHNLLDYTDADKFDVILMNPPYGGHEDKSIQGFFPDDLASSATADLLMSVILYRLKKYGRAAVVVPDGFLFGLDNAKVNIKKKLIGEFNLHTVVRLPSSVFSPYTSITTNLLFFDNTKPTTETWFYRVDVPSDRKHFSKIQCDQNYHPKKKTVMALCIALQLDLEQSKDLLARADWAFSPSSKVDLIVQKAIIDKQYDIMQLNVTLFKYTNEILGV